jgi:hypothetical protein
MSNTSYLFRFLSGIDHTFGIFVDKESESPICLSLELPYKDNKKYISRIPDGVYKCKSYKSFKISKGYILEDVANRSDIIIHTANTPSQIQGCIAPGMYTGEYKNEPAVLSSRKALDKLIDTYGGKFELIIKTIPPKLRIVGEHIILDLEGVINEYIN